MGCDIHGWVEAKIGKKWVAIAELADDGRNYERFGLLAGVRGATGVIPKGIPKDVSDTTHFHIESWSRDAHSHSFMSIKKALSIFKKTSGAQDYDLYHLCEMNEESFESITTKFRLVFWFDN